MEWTLSSHLNTQKHILSLAHKFFAITFFAAFFFSMPRIKVLTQVNFLLGLKTNAQVAKKNVICFAKKNLRQNSSFVCPILDTLGSRKCVAACTPVTTQWTHSATADQQKKSASCSFQYPGLCEVF